VDAAMATLSSSGSVVDLSTTEEFMVEVRSRASVPELIEIVTRLEQKSAHFSAVLGDPERLPTTDELFGLLRCVFSVRRRTGEILERVDSGELGRAALDLVHGGRKLGERLDSFRGVFPPDLVLPFDLAFEILHFARPDRYWLWTRWIFDPRVETGALRLVTTDEVELFGQDEEETYLAIGSALAFLHENSIASGSTGLRSSPFSVDVLLGCVYSVYLYTVLRLRMTQEFNKIVPVLPELVRRLLGVQHMEV